MKRSVNNLLLIIFFAVAGFGCSTPVESGKEPEPELMTPDEIQALADRVIRWQMEVYPPEEQGKSWRDATLFIGLTEIANTLDEESYWELARDWAGRQEWKIGLNRQHADDHAVGQVYVQFYAREGEEQMVRDLRHWIDVMLTKPLSGKELWDWCDALFMAPPAIAHLAEVSGEDKYLKFLNEKYWESKEFLYDPDHHLFYRDQRFFQKRDRQGNPEFWSRGNGWVVAGLARIMTHLPRHNSHYEQYQLLFVEMMDRIVEIQPEDGLWRTNLLSPGLFPAPEVSGTALFSYALGWGLREGILTGEKYRTAFIKSWNGLARHIDQDGKPGSVQKPGDRPGGVDKNNSEIFGTGAVLLAASEAMVAER